MHYFDTVLFEPRDEDDNILLFINNAIITIPDDDCEIVLNPFLGNSNNALATISDDEYGIVPPPTENGTTQIYV